MSLIINYRDCDVIIPKTASSSQNRLRVKLAKSTKSIIPHASHPSHSADIAIDRFPWIISSGDAFTLSTWQHRVRNS